MSPSYRMGTGAEQRRRAAYEAVDSALEVLACIAAVLSHQPGRRSVGVLADAVRFTVLRARDDLGRLKPPSRSAP